MARKPESTKHRVSDRISKVTVRRQVQILAAPALLPLLMAVLALSWGWPAVALPPVSGMARDAQNNQPLYREQRLGLTMDGRLHSEHVRFLSPHGQFLGEKALDYSTDLGRPELEYADAEGAPQQRLREDGRSWLLEERSSGAGSWRARRPKIPAKALIDDGLLQYLTAARESLLASEAHGLIWLRLPDLRARRLQLSVQVHQAGAIELLRMDLTLRALFGPGERLVRLDLERDSGRWIRYQGPPTWPGMSEVGEVIIDY